MRWKVKEKKATEAKIRKGDVIPLNRNPTEIFTIYGAQVFSGLRELYNPGGKTHFRGLEMADISGTCLWALCQSGQVLGNEYL